jgi:hypothetical protein
MNPTPHPRHSERSAAGAKSRNRFALPNGLLTPSPFAKANRSFDYAQDDGRGGRIYNKYQ